MRLFSQELNIFSWGLEYLADSQPLIFATTQTFAQSKSDRRHQGSLQRSTHCCQHREIWWGRVFEVWTLPASCEIWWATYLGWTFAQSEDDKRHFRLLLEPDAVWKYPFSLQTLYTHKDKIKKSNSVWLVFQFLSCYNSDFVFWLQRLCMDPIAGKSAHQQRHKCDLRICTSGGPALFKPAKKLPKFFCTFFPHLIKPILLTFCTLGNKKDHKMMSSYHCNFYRASR